MALDVHLRERVDLDGPPGMIKPPPNQNIFKNEVWLTKMVQMLHDTMAMVVQLRERVELNGNQARQLILRYLLVKWLVIEFHNTDGHLDDTTNS